MKIRRVVAGVDNDGKSVVLSDGLAPSTFDHQYLPGQAHTRIWRTDGTITTAPPAAEPTTDTGPLFLGPGGSSFLILQVAPDSVRHRPALRRAKAGQELATYAPGHRRRHGAGQSRACTRPPPWTTGSCWTVRSSWNSTTACKTASPPVTRSFSSAAGTPGATRPTGRPPSPSSSPASPRKPMPVGASTAPGGP